MRAFSLNEATESALMVKRTFTQAPAKVRKAFADPAALSKWWAPDGSSVVFSQWEPKVGNPWRVDVKGGSGEPLVTFGEFRDASEQMIVFSWAREGKADIGGTLVTAEFRKVPKGCELCVTHELLPSKAVREAHQEEWARRLERLGRVVG